MTIEVAEQPRRCLACGHIHGSVNVQIHCLEAKVLELTRALAPGRQLRAEVAAVQERFPSRHTGKR